MPFDAQYDYSYDGIMRSFEDSQQRLGLAEIDILLVHDLGRDTHGDRDSFYFMQFEQGGYRALDELKSSGQIKAIGLGVNEVEICKRAMNIGQFDCFLLAGRYSLLEQEPVNEFLPQCITNGTSIILGGPYNSGILATGVRTNKTPFYNYNPAPKEVILKVDKIEQICIDHNVTLAAAALQFPLAHQAVASVIPGLGNAKRVAKTVQLFNEVIPCAFWQDLKSEQLLAEKCPSTDVMSVIMKSTSSSIIEKVDSHQHFWQLSRGDYNWLTSDFTCLYKDHLPELLAPALELYGITSTIVVQAADSIDETYFLLELAQKTDFIAGVVGWVDFQANDVISHLASLSKNPYFKGIRPMLQDIDDPDWILNDDFAAIFDFFSKQQPYI